MHKALYYESRDDGKVRCGLCPHRCVIAAGRAGICRVRENTDGALYTLNYGKITAYGMDPIEKKPLYHFYPGHNIFSIGTFGCNLHCRFCQNWEIAQGDPRTVTLTSRQVVDLALTKHDNIGIAYTYSEPTVWYEYVYDTAVMARGVGLKNVLVTNGFIEREPFSDLLPYVDAVNIDVKSFTDDFYRKVCSARRDPVLRAVELAAQHCHVELTILLVTGLNDKPEEIAALRDWIASVDPAIPLHISRFRPQYKMLDRPPTPVETMHRAYEIAREKLSHVYQGNIRADETGHTFCPQCGTRVVDRTGFAVRHLNLDAENRCAGCGSGLNITGRARLNQ